MIIIYNKAGLCVSIFLQLEKVEASGTDLDLFISGRDFLINDYSSTEKRL